MSLSSPTLEQLQKGKHVVKFGAPWCGPCRSLDPVFEEIADGHKDSSFDFWSVKIDDDDEKIAQSFHVKGVPFIIFLDEGRTVDMLSPEQITQSKIVEKIAELG